MKILAIVLVMGGLVLAGFGGYQLIKSDHKQEQSLKQAKQYIEKKKSETFAPSSSSNNTAPFLPVKGSAVGVLDIPALDAELPIIEGTDPDELAKGVGHYAGTAYPLGNDQIVLSGHRDTVFRRMNDLEIGDTLTIKLPYGDFSYKVTHTRVVDADDRTVIHSTAPDEVLVLTTCYPFSYVGNAPEQYIVTAHPVQK